MLGSDNTLHSIVTVLSTHFGLETKAVTRIIIAIIVCRRKWWQYIKFLPVGMYKVKTMYMYN